MKKGRERVEKLVFSKGLTSAGWKVSLTVERKELREVDWWVGRWASMLAGRWVVRMGREWVERMAEKSAG